MSATPNSPGLPRTCPHCQNPLPAESSKCPACGALLNPETDVQAASPGVASPPRRWPAWGLLVTVLVPALLTLVTAREEGAALAFALGGGLVSAIYGACWAWMRFPQFILTRLLTSAVVGVICGFVALTINAFGCAAGGFKMD